MLIWSQRFKSISAKANSLLGMIRRFGAPSPVKFQLDMFHTYSVFLTIVHIYGPLQRHATEYILHNYSDM